MESPLSYLSKQLNGKGDFMSSYRVLSDEDKETLKRWAAEEQEAIAKQQEAKAA